MNNDPLSTSDSTPAQNRATEALLREYARLQSRDDESFLAAFEAKLAREPEPDIAPVVAQLGQQRLALPSKRGRFFQIAALAAAACLLAMASWYAGYSSTKAQPVVIVQQVPVARHESKVSAPAATKKQPPNNGTRVPQAPGAFVDLSLDPASANPLVTKDAASGLRVSAPKASSLDIAGLTGLGVVNLQNELGLLSAGSENLGHDEVLRNIMKQTSGVMLDDLTNAGPSIDRAAGGFAMTGTLKGTDRTAHSFDTHSNEDQTVKGPLAAAESAFREGATFGVFGGAILPSKYGNSGYDDINGRAISTKNEADVSTISGVLSGTTGTLGAPANAAVSSNVKSLGNTSNALSLSSTNTYTGVTTIAGGVLVSTSPGSPSSPAVPAPVRPQVKLRSIGYLGSSETNTTTSNIAINAGTLSLGAGNATIGTGGLSPVNANVTGAGGITKSGVGNWARDSLASASIDLQLENGVAQFEQFVNSGILASDTSTTRADKDASSNRYEAAPVNPFLTAQTQPLSTFSIDVDTASYANIRRLIQRGAQVPPAAVRLEEMINYFPYTYVEPTGEHPFSVKVESAACPWAPAHRLVKIALKAKEIDRSKRAAANLVFLVDVSGSMSSEDKLPLVIKNLRVLTASLNADDTVSIVTYAGNSGVALPPTHGDQKQIITNKLASLNSGGSTNGAGGITQAYALAKKHFIKEGVNRVVLCTDGDFNVGITGKQSLVDLVKERAQDGIFLTVCGYGQGNLNDSMLEAITNKGNGIYHYIDSEREGRKVFQDELFGTLVTVAKDVKLQVEFNPAQTAQYRLIGYDNRMLAKEDFANDRIDAGDLGAGHRVTALYEVIPTSLAGANSIPLKYQSNEPAPEPTKPASPELLTVKLRYKEPAEKISKPLDQPFTDDTKAKPSTDFTFAATVAEFGNWLRGERAEGRTIAQLIEAAEAARGDDPHGYRAEFVELMKQAK